MGHYVHIHVAFRCGANEGVAKVASKHLIGRESFVSKEAGWFLEELSKRTGENPGPKGGLSLWGIIGNGTNLDDFTNDLRPFFREILFTWVDDGPEAYERILIFHEPEQSEAMNVAEIFLEDELAEYEDGTGKLTIELHARMPFKANQY